ncbi:MAG: hypothetical protein IKR69_01185 [Bacteroidales bacterium]|nr:hypothetical protein [Bacteroidales bacterium]
MKVFLAAVLFVALAVIGLGFNIFFLKKPFPDGEISRNEELRRRGIKCAKEEELERLRRSNPELCSGDCSSCSYIVTEMKK